MSIKWQSTYNTTPKPLLNTYTHSQRKCVDLRCFGLVCWSSEIMNGARKMIWCASFTKQWMNQTTEHNLWLFEKCNVKTFAYIRKRVRVRGSSNSTITFYSFRSQAFSIYIYFVWMFACTDAVIFIRLKWLCIHKGIPFCCLQMAQMK